MKASVQCSTRIYPMIRVTLHCNECLVAFARKEHFSISKISSWRAAVSHHWKNYHMVYPVCYVHIDHVILKHKSWPPMSKARKIRKREQVPLDALKYAMKTWMFYRMLQAFWRMPWECKTYYCTLQENRAQNRRHWETAGQKQEAYTGLRWAYFLWRYKPA